MSSGSAKARRRVGVKRKRDGMDPAGSDAAEPPLSVEQEVRARRAVPCRSSPRGARRTVATLREARAGHAAKPL